MSIQIQQSAYHNCCQCKIGVLNWQQSQWADWWIWIDTLTECGLPVLQVGTSGQSTLREGPGGLGPPNLFLSQREAPMVPYQQNSLMVRKIWEEGKRTLAASDTFFHVAANHICGRNWLVFKWVLFNVECISQGDTLDFKWGGCSNGGKNPTLKNPLPFQQNLKKSLDQNLTPKNSHAKFLSLKILKKH